jgi:hypothetical protein
MVADASAAALTGEKKQKKRSEHAGSENSISSSLVGGGRKTAGAEWLRCNAHEKRRQTNFVALVCLCDWNKSDVCEW